jgi:formamidopyrimidine-DNA glycosylase
MPELPEVESICREISPCLSGAKILDVNVLLPRILRSGDAASAIGREILSVRRRAKFIDLALDGGVSLVFHLGMTGQLLWDYTESLEDRYVRAILITNNGRLSFRDVRTLGGIWVVHPEQKFWDKLGPDPFSAGFSADYLQESLAGRSSAIKLNLLDQSIVGGIGNIYASEILFRAEIHPLASSCTLKAAVCVKIVEETRRTLQSAIESSGTTFRDFRLSDGREGEFAEFLQVYGRGNQPCRKCGTLIVRIVQAQRSTYFCPTCQPLNNRNRPPAAKRKR